MGDIRRDWKFKMNPYLWPVLMILAFLAAMVMMPRGLPMSLFDLFEPQWLVFEGCVVVMVVFWALWVSGSKWDE